MAKSPNHYVLITEEGVTRIDVRYARPFRQTLRIEIPKRPEGDAR